MTDIFDCARAQVYYNPGKLTPAQIKAKTGCTHIINGYLFNGKFQPVGWTVIDGKVISRDAYQDWGISIGSDGAPKMLTDRGGSFLSGVPLLKAGAKLRRNLTPDVARSAARTAVGWTPNGKICLWCDKTSLTREQLQNKLLGLGVEDAIMLDGGGSTQGIFPKGKVKSSRKVPTLLLFWERKAETANPSPAPTKPEDPALAWGKAQGAADGQQSGETGDPGGAGSGAVQAERRIGMDVKVYSLAADGDKYLTPHFQVKEFRCRDGSDVVLIHEQLPWDLESIRYQASQEHGKGKEIPLIINSGYRTVAYNSTLKNASKHSQHLYGYAADIHMPGVSIKDLKRYARNVSPNHGGVGVYGSFLHFDKREAKADWTG